MIPAHYVRPNESTRLPRHFFFLDCEAYQSPTPRGEVQTFRLGAVRYVGTRKDRPKATRDERDTFAEPEALWEWVDDRCRANGRSVLVAHNLAYDLRVSRALSELPRRGWSMKAGKLDAGSAWLVMRKGRKSLVMVDSLSWFPKGLDHLATLVGIHKPPLPKANAPVGTWLERCEADVDILAECWLRVMRWLEAEDLGNWRMTGAGQSWQAFRHRFYTHPILVHADDEAREAERTAAWAGRCEAWRHGIQRGGPFAEWDFTAAYAQIAHDVEVPVKLRGVVERPSLDERLAERGRRLTLHQCLVTTDVPTVPARSDDGIHWPVGTFRTTLWNNERALAITNGATVTTERMWVYRKAPALRAWAEWVLGQLHAPADEVDPVVRLVVKHWSRALVGRFASRWSTWQAFGTAHDFDVLLREVIDTDAGDRFQLLQLGRDLYRADDAGDSPDAAPQIMSYVMAEARCRLWRAMVDAGLSNVLYVDTDGLIVNAEGDERLRRAAVSGLRCKARYHNVRILGPRQLLLGDTLRAAGVPSRARRGDDGTYSAEAWRQLGTSLRIGEHDRVVITERTFDLRGTDKRRRHLDGGRTAPHVVSLSDRPLTGDGELVDA